MPGRSREETHTIYWKTTSDLCVTRGLLLATFWTCEMGHEESGISAPDRHRRPQASFVVCKDRFVRTGECSSGSVGRLEKWITPFPSQNWCAGIQLLYVSNLGQHRLPGGRVIILPGLSGGFNLDNYQVKEALCISPALGQSHLWPPRWQQLPALSSLLNHHISDSLSYQRWTECLQTDSLTRRCRRSKEAPGDAQPNATGGPDGERLEISQDLACFPKVR